MEVEEANLSCKLFHFNAKQSDLSPLDCVIFTLGCSLLAKACILEPDEPPHDLPPATIPAAHPPNGNPRRGSAREWESYETKG